MSKSKANRQIRIMLAACSTIVAAALMGPKAWANTTIVVDTTATTSATGTCTLSDAINTAQGTPIAGSSCNSTPDTAYTIMFKSGVTGTISLTASLPQITGDLTIIGPTSSPGITIDGGGAVQIMNVHSGAMLTINNVTIAHGQSNSDGGGILNGGTLTINNSTFEANAAGSTGSGGAVSNGGTLTVTDSTFFANESLGNLLFCTIGQLPVCTCIIEPDGSSQCSCTSGSPPVCTNPGMGGAIYNDGTLSVTNSTFSANNAIIAGGGIYNHGSAASIKGTILALEPTGQNCSGNASITDDGYNISDDTSCGFAGTGANGNPIGDGIDPMLDPNGLQDNGGPTQTIALVAGSPAIDAIPAASCTDQASPPNQLTSDQRGMPRPDPGDSPAVCDIGAYELQDEVPFAHFSVTADINLPDDFVLAGGFTLAAGRPAIDPRTQPTIITIGASSLTIPAASFRRILGSFLFIGKAGGVSDDAAILPAGKNNYVFAIRGDGLSLSGVSNPVTVGLQIGNDGATASVRAHIH